MMLKAIIVDDEPLAHKVILEYAKEVDYLKIVGQCHLATEALAELNKQAVDLIFLDINMPKLKGLDFLRTLNKQPLVIITSAYEEYALESYELKVCDYLLKPFRFDRFLKATNRALETFQLQNNESTTSETNTTELEQLIIKSDKKLIQINIQEIYFLESYGNYVKIWLKDNYHLTPGTMSGFEQQLPALSFYRIHKSFLINRSYIDYLEGNTLVLKNKKRLPVGKNHRQDFKRYLSG